MHREMEMEEALKHGQSQPKPINERETRPHGRGGDSRSNGPDEHVDQHSMESWARFEVHCVHKWHKQNPSFKR